MSKSHTFVTKSRVGPQTSLSRFVRDAPSREKKRVYTAIIEKSIREQRSVLMSASKKKAHAA